MASSPTSPEMPAEKKSISSKARILTGSVWVMCPPQAYHWGWSQWVRAPVSIPRKAHAHVSAGKGRCQAHKYRKAWSQWNAQRCTVFPYPRGSAVHTTGLLSITFFCSVHVWLSICLEGSRCLCKPITPQAAECHPLGDVFHPTFLRLFNFCVFFFLFRAGAEQAYALHTLGKQASPPNYIPSQDAPSSLWIQQ